MSYNETMSSFKGLTTAFPQNNPRVATAFLNYFLLECFFGSLSPAGIHVSLIMSFRIRCFAVYLISYEKMMVI